MTNVEILGDQELFKGLRFNVVRRRMAIDNRVIERDVVLFPPSVTILPVLQSNKFILIKQYRAPIKDYIIEAPAGVVEPGEDIREAARRELIEETGYDPGELIYIGKYYPVPGYSTEAMHFFIARRLEYVGKKPEPYEVIEPLVVSMDEALDLVKRNEIADLKTVFLITYYTHYMWKDVGGED